MPNRRTPNPPRSGALWGGRVIRKRAPAVPAAMMDRTLIDLLTQTDVPLSAYDLAAGLRGLGREVAVMSVYRALDRLCATDAVEKVATLSAYRVKDIPKAILTICLSCGRTQPIPAPDLHDQLERVVLAAGFMPGSTAIETTGLCPQCRARTPGSGMPD